MDSDEDSHLHKKEGPKKTKRQMKTPYQLETLEKAYASETYPSEAIRGELSKKLGLTDRQLQMWFCHRRLKDKKEAAGISVIKLRAVKPRAPPAAAKRSMVESSQDEMEAEPVSEPVSRSGFGSGSRSGSGSGSGSGSSRFDNGDEMPPVAAGGYYESSSAMMVRRVVACVEAQLGEPLREDGPILGVEFDVLPPGAFGTPIVTAEHRDQYRNSYEKKSYGSYDRRHIKPSTGNLHDHDELKIRSNAYGQVAQTYIYESPIVAPGSKTVSSVQGNGHLPREYGAEGLASSANVLPQQGRQGQLHSPLPSDAMMTKSEEIMQIERKRKSDEDRMERDFQHEKRVKKELEKQDQQKRKMEEQMKKEMEKQDRDRKKEELRLMREQQRKEERFQREEKREMERREKFMQKELLRAERKKQKDDVRRERELVRQKAAMERAAARRIAKESLELIEDERLELMDLAASSKGLPSIVSLDYEALQDLESFRVSLCQFPPESVKLKKPFGIHPWADSEENVGNLLMVWKFCITFADLLGLWPFTLDEFIQAFHDYDSRLLGEIHIALLKMIIKDIEDVVRTPTGGPGTNQYSVFNPEGGHPQIVEGAYVWGFDIRSWQKHLNPLTWPEILRQFALSAGFGPELKKKDTERGNTNENDETKGCEDIVSTLRNGSAAKSAANTMREKGVSLQRKSRHRLTPGTVKFAAYHVLALEGSKGLNVLDLAEKIQKSGLRDLSTSKTPEASISVALSRDPVLFERIAPSTYNVRPAYRKDPADAETIIAEARDKIQRFVNGVLTGQNAEDEGDDDSDCDVAEVAEVDDLATPSDANKIIEGGNEVGSSTGNGKESITAEIPVPKEIGSDGASKPDLGGEIDESRSGQPWVQGLTEGEYSELSVEERLNALVVLVGIANEGNSIRVILEDRLDAACALKKQMWAEAQLDKRRLREDIVTKFGESGYGAPAEGSQSPLAIGYNRNGEASPDIVVKDEPAFGMGNVHNQMDSIQQNGSTAERSRMQMKAFIGHRAEEMYVYRSLPLGSDRRRNRYWLFVASPSSHDPGSGRIFVESPEGCWRLIDTEETFDALLMSLDMRGVRESHLHIMLQKIEGPFRDRIRSNLSRGLATGDNGMITKSEFAEVRSSPGGSTSAESPSSSVSATNADSLEPSPTFKIEFGRTELEKENALKRYQDLQNWLWKECFSSTVLRAMSNGKNRCTPLLGVCSLCLDSFLAMKPHYCSANKSSNVDSRQICMELSYPYEDELNVEPMGKGTSDSSQQPLRIRLIKVLLNSLEASVPYDALQSFWTEDLREAWASKLLKSSSTDDLLQVLTQFEGAIKRDKLSSSFETTEELLSYCASVKKLSFGSIDQLPWIPQTTAAVALRLLDLDASITFGEEEQKPYIQEEKKVETPIQKLPSRYANTGSGQKVQTMEVNIDKKRTKEDAWEVNGDNKRPRGPARPRGKVLKAPGPASEVAQQSSKHGTLTQALMQQQGERSYGQKHSRGRRTVRKRRTEKSTPEEKLPVDRAGIRLAAGMARHASAMMVEKPASPSFREVEENTSSSDDGVDSDENAPETTYNYGDWGSGFTVAPCRTNSNVMEMSEDEDESEDDNVVEDNAAGHMQVDGLGMNDSDYEFDRNVDRQHIVEEEEEEDEEEEEEEEASDSGESGDYSD